MPKARHRLYARKVDRIAIVDKPAVPDAEILLFKRKKGEESVDNLDLPIAKMDTEWNESEARTRVLAHASEKENFDYHKCFMVVPEDIEKKDDLKLQFADLIDGELSIVPDAVYSIVKRVSFFEDNMDKEVKSAIIDNCKSLYEKMGKTFPWLLDITTEKSYTPDFNAIALSNVMSGMMSAMNEVSWYVLGANDKTKAEKKALFKKEFDKFTSSVKQIMNILIDNLEKRKSDDLTVEKFLDTFKNSLNGQSIEKSFSELKNSLDEVSQFKGKEEDFDKALTGIFSEFEKSFDVLLEKGEDKTELSKMLDPVISGDEKIPSVKEIEKVGKKISSSRLKKLKEVVDTLGKLLTEVDESVEKNQSDDKGEQSLKLNVESKELTEAIEKFQKQLDGLKGISEQVEKLDTHLKSLDDRHYELKETLYSKGILLTEKEEALKKQKQKDQVAEIEKRKRDSEESLKLEKKKLEDRLEKFEKTLQAKDTVIAELKTSITNISKKFGAKKTSLDVNADQNLEPEEDVFGKALRGRK